MSAISRILSGIPLWVYAIFAYGVWMGIRALSVKTLSIRRMVLMPLIFLVISLSSLISVVGHAPLIGVAWGFFVAIGFVLGWFFLAPEPLSFNSARMQLVVKGTPLVLILFIVLFSVKVFYGYANAVHLAAASEPLYQLVIFGLSGASTGIVAGRTGQLLLTFFQAREEENE